MPAKTFAAAAVAQSVKRPKGPSKRCNRADVSLIPGHGIGVREKILTTPSMGVCGKVHV